MLFHLFNLQTAKTILSCVTLAVKICTIIRLQSKAHSTLNFQRVNMNLMFDEIKRFQTELNLH